MRQSDFFGPLPLWFILMTVRGCSVSILKRVSLFNHGRSGARRGESSLTLTHATNTNEGDAPAPP